MPKTSFDYKRKHYVIEVEPDDCADDPSTEDGFLWKIAYIKSFDFMCDRAKTIPDAKQQEAWDHIDPGTRGYALKLATLEWIENQMAEEAKARGDELIAFPLWGWEHSGCGFSLKPLSDGGPGGGWDTSRVGFMYALRSDAEKLGRKWPAGLDDAEANLSTYNAYLGGYVYWYKLSRVDRYGNEIEELDSCGGFIDNDERPEWSAAQGMAEQMYGYIDGMSEEELVEKIKAAM
jgi:hypothetical protein